MAKIFNGMIPFASAIQPTGAQPLDDRVVVAKFSDLTDDSTFGLAKYDGMIVAVVEDQQVYMLVDAANSTSSESWVAVGTDFSGDISGLQARIGVVEGKVNVAADSGLDATSALRVKIDSTVAGNILQVSNNGLSVVASQSEYSLDAVAEPEDGYAAQYQFKKDGTVQTTINIPKDQFLKDASYNAADDKLVFVFNTMVDGVYTEKTVDVDVKDLVDVYTGSDYITVTDNQISVNYNALKTQLDTDLRASFGIATIASDVDQNKTDIADVKSALNAEGTGITAKITAVEASVSGHETRISAVETSASANATAINGLRATISDLKVKDVDTTESYGVSLALVDPNNEDDDTTATHVKVNVDIAKLAAEVASRHEVPTPDASAIKVIATEGSSFTEDTNVQAAIINLDSRIQNAVAGGMTGVNAGTGISVTGVSNNPTVSVKTSDLVAAGSALKVTDNKIDLTWETL